MFRARKVKCKVFESNENLEEFATKEEFNDDDDEIMILFEPDNSSAWNLDEDKEPEDQITWNRLGCTDEIQRQISHTQSFDVPPFQREKSFRKSQPNMHLSAKEPKSNTDEDSFHWIESSSENSLFCPPILIDCEDLKEMNRSKSQSSRRQNKLSIIPMQSNDIKIASINPTPMSSKRNSVNLLSKSQSKDSGLADISPAYGIQDVFRSSLTIETKNRKPKVVQTNLYIPIENGRLAHCQQSKVKRFFCEDICVPRPEKTNQCQSVFKSNFYAHWSMKAVLMKPIQELSQETIYEKLD